VRCRRSSISRSTCARSFAVSPSRITASRSDAGPLGAELLVFAPFRSIRWSAPCAASTFLSRLWKPVNPIVAIGDRGYRAIRDRTIVLSGTKWSITHCHATISRRPNCTNLDPSGFVLTVRAGIRLVKSGKLALRARHDRSPLLNQKGRPRQDHPRTASRGAWARRGKRIILIDADPQGRRWTGRRARQGRPSRLFGVIGLPTRSLAPWKPPKSPRTSITSSSTGPRGGSVLRSALLASDLVVRRNPRRSTAGVGRDVEAHR